MTYPCHRCNMDEGSPVCLQDERCPKQSPMTVEGFFAEAKRLNLRMLGTPEETRAALDLKDAEIAKLRECLKWLQERHHGGLMRAKIDEALGPNVGIELP